MGLDARNCRDVLPIRRQNNNTQSGNLNGVARLNNAPRLTLNRLEIRSVPLLAHVGVFAIFSVIDELTNFNMLEKIGHTAYVINVVVRNHDVIDAA